MYEKGTVKKWLRHNSSLQCTSFQLTFELIKQHYMPRTILVALSFLFIITLLFAQKAIIKNEQSSVSNSVAWTAGWSYNDEFVAVGNDRGELVIYKTKNWEIEKKWKYNATTITRVEWNPRYPILAVTAVSHDKKDSAVQLFDMALGKPVIILPPYIQGRALSWKPDGEQIAFVGAKGSIHIYSRFGKLLKKLSYTNPSSLFDIDWHPSQNKLLAVEEDIYVIDIDNDKLLATYNDGSAGKGILCCQWHPTGNGFATDDYGHENEGREPSLIRFWKTDGTLIKQVKEAKFEFRNIKWSKDGRYMAASSDVLLIFNEHATLLQKIKFDDNNLWAVEWNATGDKLVTGDQAGNIRICDITGKILYSFKL